MDALARNATLLWIGTGGTIAAGRDQPDGPLCPRYSIPELVAAVPGLESMADWEYLSLMEIDSTDFGTAEAVHLFHAISSRIATVQGVLVTAGTDRLAEVAAAIAILFDGQPPVPIVLTGSQRPCLDIGSDGPANLRDSALVLQQAVANALSEVFVVFGGDIISGLHVIKSSDRSDRGFSSCGVPPRGRIRADTVEFAPRLRPRTRNDSLARVRAPARFASGVIRICATVDPDILKDILELRPSGVVLEAFGNGNVPHCIAPSLQQAASEGLPVVVVSAVPGARVQPDLYEAGLGSRGADLIPGGTMLPHVAELWLRHLVARNASLDTIRELTRSFLAHHFPVMQTNDRVRPSVPKLAGLSGKATRPLVGSR